ncbi:MAG: flavin reductase family protein [Halobacteriovoraceae bacterium]|nr:flavin reductase family protein [Halobacteriovoraceae bacterium]
MLSFSTDESFQQNYKFLIGSLVPRPIALVSTKNEDGSNNLAPFSFFTAISARPMIIAFCPLIRTSTGLKKDTVINIERTKEFVINFVSEEIIQKVNLTSTEVPYGEDEFKLSGLTPLESEIVSANRVQESKIHFECRLRDILNYGDEPGAGRLISGEVVKVHINNKIYSEGKINTNQYKPIGRGAGNDWIKCTDIIQLERLMTAQIQK